MMKALTILLSVWLSGCSVNNLFLGEVRATVGTHSVTVTDCYRFSVDPPKRIGDQAFEFTPCRDARIIIVNDQLTVNGEAFGHLNPNDRILVDHSVVSIQHAS